MGATTLWRSIFAKSKGAEMLQVVFLVYFRANEKERPYWRAQGVQMDAIFKLHL